MALGGVVDKTTLALLTTLVERDDTLYYWRFGTIAEVDGERAAASIAYPGAEYHRRRLISFNLAREAISFDTEAMEDESVAGELYLDTLAVMPAFRRHGLARTLLEHWLSSARRQGLTPTLACAKDNDRARRLYESVGLRNTADLFIFGEYYNKMQP